MIQFPILARARLSALFRTARSAVCLSRILLLIVAVELLTMPFTQGLWSWDKFLHGGQDFELGLLIIFTCLCLVLLRVEQSRHDSGDRFLQSASFSSKPRPANSCSHSLWAFVRTSSADPRDIFPPRSFDLPLLI